MTFPLLRTGAVAQYPAERSLRFRNQTVRFVNGAEQRHRDCSGVLHRWRIHFDQIDEREAAAIEDFFAESEGSFADFSFTDPWDGIEYPNCSLEFDLFDVVTLGELDSRVSVSVVENR